MFLRLQTPILTGYFRNRQGQKLQKPKSYPHPDCQQYFPEYIPTFPTSERSVSSNGLISFLFPTPHFL